MNYLIERILVKNVMIKDVVTASEEMPIAEAARLMVDNKSGRSGATKAAGTHRTAHYKVAEHTYCVEPGINHNLFTKQQPRKAAAVFDLLMASISIECLTHHPLLHIILHCPSGRNPW
jgi:CBS domain-containing protein